MDRKISQPLTKAFDDMMQRLPCAFVTSDGQVSASCLGLYCAQLTSDLTAFIMLQAHRTRDRFTVELACSRSGRWPAFLLPNPPVVDQL